MQKKKLEENQENFEKYKKIKLRKSEINDFCKGLSYEKGYRFIKDIGREEKSKLLFYVDKNYKQEEVEKYIKDIFQKYNIEIKEVPEAVEENNKEEVKDKKIEVEINISENFI